MAAHRRKPAVSAARAGLVEAVWDLIRRFELTVNETHMLLASVGQEFASEAVTAERLEEERVRRPVRRKKCA